MLPVTVCCLLGGCAASRGLLADHGDIGTFARVWLVRLADPRPEDRDKVFALKVLRKVDGILLPAASQLKFSCLLLAVIKLKQVDHVNHERSVLADVAGHPFITTLITSFSDHDSLYMLVSRPPPPGPFPFQELEFIPKSSITALEAKYSPTYAKRNALTRTPLDSTQPK